ncbi:MAG: methyltransferase domain-containing protein [Polyangiaceae bacterium]
MSVESAPDVFPLSKPAEPASRPIPPVGMSSEPNVVQSITQTPPGGIEVGPPRAAQPVAQAAPAPAATPAAPAQREPREARDAEGGPKSPRVIVPPHASPLAPQPPEQTARKRQRPWWEDLFNDDYIRTMAKITDEQIAREVDFIEDSLGVARGAMILDMACGTGRHAIELTQRGYRVVGLDLSLAMLAKAAEEAQERGQKLNFVQGDMREMTFEDMFDGVYCWNTSFGFFEEERNAQVIQRVHRALRKGGQFVLDVMNRDFALSQQPSLVWFEGDGCICMDEMQIDWITSRMRVKRTMMMDDGRSREIEYSLRIYSLHELGKMLHDHGFRVAEVSGRVGTPGVFFGAESPNVLVLAEKR